VVSSLAIVTGDMVIICNDNMSGGSSTIKEANTSVGEKKSEIAIDRLSATSRLCKPKPKQLRSILDGQKAGSAAEKVILEQGVTQTDKTDDLSDQSDASDDSN
jgi:hypothetical protein